MGLPHATAMVVGTIIGASIFVQPSEVTSRVPSVSGVLLVWAVSGVLTLFGALVCAELASTFTQSGGVYVYLKEAFSPAMGFLWGWAMLWVMHSGIIAVVAMVIARYALVVAPGIGDRGQPLLAVTVILILSAVNYIGVKHGSTLQALFTLGKLVAVAAMIAVGFTLGSRIPEHFVSPASAGVTVHDFALSLVAGLFAFGGWHMVAYNSEETTDPRRTIPIALVLGTLIVTVCYILLNTVYLYVLPLEKVATSQHIAADAANAVLGPGGAAIMSGLVVFSSFGALSGIILSGPRVYYAMASDGLLFGWMGGIHPRFRTPHRAIVVQAIWSSVLVLTGSYETLFTRVVYTEWIFFGLMAIGLFVLRRRKDLRRDYSMWGYPVVPGVFALASFAVVANHIWSDPRPAAAGISLVLLGLPVYGAWAWIKKKQESRS